MMVPIAKFCQALVLDMLWVGRSPRRISGARPCKALGAVKFHHLFSSWDVGLRFLITVSILTMDQGNHEMNHLGNQNEPKKPISQLKNSQGFLFPKDSQLKHFPSPVELLGPVSQGAGSPRAGAALGDCGIRPFLATMAPCCGNVLMAKTSV